MKALMLSLLLLAPLAAQADSPIDGTWIAKEDTAALDKKPVNLSLANGVWKNESVAPAVKIKADGTDQAVTGHDYYDTLAAKELGPDSVETTGKKAGKITTVNTYTVSADGKTLTRKFSDQTGTEPATGEFVLARIAQGPKGSHAVSGSWRTEKIQNLSASAKTVTYKGSADGLSMTNPAGMSYEAKFDGKDYPISGDPGGTMVSVKHSGGNTYVETYKRKGKVVEVDKTTVAKDGKTAKVEWEDKETHRKGHYDMEKKP